MAQLVAVPTAVAAASMGFAGQNQVSLELSVQSFVLQGVSLIMDIAMMSHKALHPTKAQGFSDNNSQ